MSLAVVGTDTGVGKTVISALLAKRYRASYWKPVATGLQDDHDPRTVQALTAQQVHVWPSCYTFNPPVSPHLAGRLANEEVCSQTLLQTWQNYKSRPTIVEGIGGVLVPLNDAGELFADWLQWLQIPCIVVATASLGTINHSLLTIEALRARHIHIAGVVLNGDPASAPHNAEAIERFGKVQILGFVPWQTSLNHEACQQLEPLVDTRHILQPYFVQP